MRHLFLATVALTALAAPAAGQVVVPPTVSLVEGQPWAVAVQRPAGSRKGTTVGFSWRTIPDTAIAGLDFTARSGKQSIRKNSVVWTLTGTTIDDALFELDKRFFVEVTVPGFAPVRTAVVIRDNDAAPPPPAQLAVNESACSEGDPCTVTFSRAGGDLSKAATFDWFTTTGGTAVEGVDYEPRSGSLTFAPGAATGPVATFQSIENLVDAPDKTVMVGIRGLDAPVAVPQHAINLIDDDEAPPPPPPPVPCPDGSTVPAGQTCPVPPPPPPPTTETWVKCADTNFTCYTEGTAKVRYGNATVGWTTVDPVTGSIQCSRETFQVDIPSGVAGLICQTTSKPTVFSYVAPPPGTPGWVVAPTPDGKVPINMAEGDMVDVGVTAEGSAAPDVLGALRFFCAAGSIQRDDPIVKPGQPGAAHWHQFYGNKAVNAWSTYESYQTEGADSTCTRNGNGVPGNLSAYWTSSPIVTVPTGSYVPLATLTLQPGSPTIGGVMSKPTEHHWVPDGNTLYYKGRPSGDPACKGVSPWGPQYLGCVPIPHGLRAVFGFDMVKLLDSEAPMSFRCLSAAGVQIGPMGPRMMDALKNCPVGARLAQVIHAQNCWDGKHTDSPNHQDHMSYSMQKLGTGKGGCKPTRGGVYELKLPPTLTLLTSWTVTQAVADAVKADPVWGVRLSSDDHLRAMRPNEAWSGRTGHADIDLAWLAKMRDRWHFGGLDKLGVFQKGCIEGLKNCSAGDTGTGKMFGWGGAPFYKSVGRTLWGHPNNLVPVRPEGWTADW